MAVLAMKGGEKKILKILSAGMAALLSFPGIMLAQVQRMTSDWLQLSPSDPKAGIPSQDPKSGVVSLSGGETTVSIERRSRPRSRRDSLAGVEAYEAAQRDPHLRIVVSLEDRTLWVVVASDTVLEAPVAVGTGETLVFGERIWKFDTPRGIRRVRGKDSDPRWIPPDWAYAEAAAEYGFELEHLSLKKPKRISDGRMILFRDGEAGVLHPDSGFAFLPLDEHIVFDNTLFIPPVGSRNRKIQGELGKYKLDTGGGVLLHGTPHQTSIGKAATHGCLRLRDEDIEWLYQYIPVGTRVYIY